MQWQYIPTEEEVQKNVKYIKISTIILSFIPIIAPVVSYFYNFDLVFTLVSFVFGLGIYGVWFFGLRKKMYLHPVVFTLTEAGIAIENMDTNTRTEYTWDSFACFSFDVGVMISAAKGDIPVSDNTILDDTVFLIKKDYRGSMDLRLQNNKEEVRAELLKYLPEK